MDDSELRDALAKLTPDARDVLRRAARADQWERDGFAHRLMREPGGQDAADLIDSTSLDAQFRRQVVRVLGWLQTE